MNIARRIYGALSVVLGSALFVYSHKWFHQKVFENPNVTEVGIWVLFVIAAFVGGALFAVFLSDFPDRRASYRHYLTAAIGGMASVVAVSFCFACAMALKMIIAAESMSRVGDFEIVIFFSLLMFVTPFGWYLLFLGAVAAVCAQWIWLNIAEKVGFNSS